MASKFAAQEATHPSRNTLPLRYVAGAVIGGFIVSAGVAQVYANDHPSNPDLVTDSCESKGYRADQLAGIGTDDQQTALTASRLGGTFCRMADGEFARVIE